MSTLPKARLTPEQYLEIEDTAEYKSEYYQGEMFAMSGATLKHNLIVGNAFEKLKRQRRGRSCIVCMSDMRIHIPRSGLYTYPDVAVACGGAKFLGPKETNLLNHADHRSS